MARLASQAAAGFFPTPPRVVAALCRHLAPSGGGQRRAIRLLDPCAGTGEPAAALAGALGGESFGIELNADRAEACHTSLDHLIAGSAFGVRLTNGAFSCLFLNPPYDADDEARRLEHAFLVGLSRALCPGGALIFLIPQVRLAVSARYLAAHYGGFRAYRFPDPEFAAFGQMVLLATKRARPAPDPAAQVQLEGWATADLPPLPEVPEGSPLAVTALPHGEVLFAPLAFDQALAAEEARRRGVWAQPAFAEQLWPPEERPVRPLMPLRRGHLALLIAAGILNNVALRQGDRRVLVKGRARKELVAVESEDEDTEVQIEVLRASVVALDLATGQLERVELAGSDGDAPEREAGAA